MLLQEQNMIGYMLTPYSYYVVYINTYSCPCLSLCSS